MGTISDSIDVLIKWYPNGSNRMRKVKKVVLIVWIVFFDSSTGSSPTTYALLGHSSSYYGTAPSTSATPTHGQVTSVVGGPASTHSSVYQSIVYPHTHQYHHGSIHHTETRSSLYAQSPHHASPSLYRLPSGGVDNRHHLQQHDGYLESLHSAGGNGSAGEIGGALHGLTGSPPDNANGPVNSASNGSVSPEHDTTDSLGRTQPSTDPAVWRPY